MSLGIVAAAPAVHQFSLASLWLIFRLSYVNIVFCHISSSLFLYWHISSRSPIEVLPLTNFNNFCDFLLGCPFLGDDAEFKVHFTMVYSSKLQHSQQAKKACLHINGFPATSQAQRSDGIGLQPASMLWLIFRNANHPFQPASMLWLIFRDANHLFQGSVWGNG